LRVWANHASALGDYIERRVRFYRKKNGDRVLVHTDMPDVLAKRVAAKVYDSDVPKLNAVITAPTLRPDGSVLQEPG
jgi:hypothetical protein